MKKPKEKIAPKCAHKNIKFFELHDKILCLDCGEEWKRDSLPIVTVYPVQTPVYIQPVYPQMIPYAPQPSWWPTITCSNTTIEAQENFGGQLSDNLLRN